MGLLGAVNILFNQLDNKAYEGWHNSQKVHHNKI